MKEIRITDNDAGQRLDRFLQKHFVHLPTSMMYKGIRNKKIKVNRKRCTPNQILESGDILLIFLPMDVLEEKKKTIRRSSKPISVIYENENILIVYKPKGLLSQSDQKESQDTMVDRIQSYLYSKHEYDPSKENSFAPAICNRLDRNTEGLILAAKNAQALRILNEAIREHKIQKHYRALVSGHLDQKEISCHLFMKKEGTRALVSKHDQEGYKEAIMDIVREKIQGNDTWIHIILHTGRFHQIRACLAYLGHPLVGDYKYGYHGSRKDYSLCAYRLDFDESILGIERQSFSS